MNRITKMLGIGFFGGWCACGSVLYIKAVIEFLS